MKRKRGNKKSKRKGGTEAAGKEGNSVVIEDNSGLEELDNENDNDNDNNNDSVMEIDTPSSTGTDHLNAPPSVDPESSMDKPAGKLTVGRVKVKLKTSKIMDAQLNSSDVPTQSDTDKSSPHLGLENEKQISVSEKMEDSANSLPEKEIGVSGIASKKPGSIKIKASKSLGGLGINTSSSTVKTQGGSQMAHQDSRPNKKELDSALVVIKKIMKMDAAEPFNVPVNPVALGIPDYFDVINTPMDFGTICSNLESNVKYMNSKDVFKDVQYIWENCYKYNNKGDYILDLMRRVKKNFSKYWAAAGLYSGVSATNGETQENGGVTGQVKHPKGSKQKSKKRHGRRHKSDCLCAICVLKRRRKEREEIARIANDPIGAGNNLAQEFKVEESVHGGSPGSADSSSNADDSQDNDIDVEEETGEEVKMDVSKQQFSTPEEKQDEGEEEEDEEGNEMEENTGDDSKGTEQAERSREDRSRPSKSSMEQSADLTREDVLQQDGRQPDLLDSERNKEVEEKRKKKLKVWEELSIKTPKVLELCGVVFPASPSPKSVWRGPHSLLPQHRTSRVSSIHMAINQLMKK